MPFAKLTVEQIEAVLGTLEKVMEVPGVTGHAVEFIDDWKRQPGIVVYVDTHDRTGMAQLPTSVAGVPVIARIEDPKSGKILETIESPRTGGERLPLGGTYQR